MRILSCRIARARRDRLLDRVEAIVALLVDDPLRRDPNVIRVIVSAPARASDGAPLRQRLYAAAKLSFAINPAAARAATEATRRVA